MKTKKIILSSLVVLIFLSANLSVAQGFYGEAPLLSEQVVAGELPIADERLPSNPLVVQPEEEIGTYGGTWYFGMLRQGDVGTFNRVMAYEGLLRWDPQWTRIIPNVAQSFEPNDDATIFTFTLRAGMKWSDGMPFTTEDVVFWAQVTNQEENGLVVTAVDETTVQFVFDEPNGLFPQRMASLDGVAPVKYPKHYLSQFHLDYNEDAATIAAEAGFTNWQVYFNQRSSFHQNPELPTLNPWLLTSAYPINDVAITAVRNPYYWKIDPDFNQLPYIDEIVFRQFETTDAISTWAAFSGELGMQDRYTGARANRALFEEQMDTTGYSFFDLLPSFSNVMVIGLNHTTSDNILRELIQTKDFKIALSHAIDREAIIEVVLDGEGI
ncbi:MAG: ABC transporter substrate-binding protein, partial [Bacteroidota bacterium]